MEATHNINVRLLRQRPGTLREKAWIVQILLRLNHICSPSNRVTWTKSSESSVGDTVQNLVILVIRLVDLGRQAPIDCS